MFHYNLLDNVWGWETQVNRPNIDITQISYNVFKERIEFKLEIAGEFQSNENIEYGIIFISTDASYNISWSAGNGSGLAIVLNESSYVIDSQPNITVSENELVGSFNRIGDTAPVGFYGYAIEYTDTEEWWTDYVPDMYFPYINDLEQTGGDDDISDDDSIDDSGDTTQDQSDNTSGFELFIFIISIMMCFVLIRRKRN